MFKNLIVAMEAPCLERKPSEITPLTSFASSVSFADDDSLELSNRGSSRQGGYLLYRQRWLVLASYCLLNVSNGWIWALWSPLTALLADYWEVSESDIDALSGIYMYVFVPMNIVSMWLVVNYLGLGKGLQLGALLNLVGALVMYAGGRDGWVLLEILSSWTDYQIKYLGIFLCALAQAFVLPMVALMSSNWFGEEERARATSIGSLGFQLGSLFGLGSTVIVDFRDDVTGTLDPQKLDQYMRLSLFVALWAFILVLVTLIHDRPPTPPSEAAATLVQDKNVTVKYIDSIRLVLSSPSSRMFFLLFGLTIGVFYSIPAFFSQFMPAWSPRNQGILGGLFQVAAVFGCWAAGNLIPFFQLQYKKISVCLLFGCVISVALYTVSVQYQSYLAVLACGGIGFFFSSFMAVGIEFGTALSFPADEAAVYGLLDSTAELFGYLLVTLGGAMSLIDFQVAFCCVLLVLLSISLVTLWRLEALVRRPSLMSGTSTSFIRESNSQMS